MNKIIWALVVIVVIILLYKRENYWSCRDCPSDAEWPKFTTQDITVINPFLWPFSALPTRIGNENFTSDKTNSPKDVKVRIEEHAKPTKAETDHDELTS